MSAAVSKPTHAADLRVRELGVGDVAKGRGIHRNTARAFLKDLEAKHGNKVVYRRGGRLYTTEQALAPFVVVPPSGRLLRVVNDHSEHLKELEKRVDAQARELIEFRRQALTWFRRFEEQEKRIQPSR